jgi:hypothetical protein
MALASVAKSRVRRKPWVRRGWRMFKAATAEACAPTALDNRSSNPRKRRLLAHLPSPEPRDAPAALTFAGAGAT